jgi:dipeptidyl aminopeptidase/acylaminoacyl peptidase
MGKMLVGFCMVGMSLFGGDKMELGFGSWESPITADTVVANTVRLGDVKEINGSIYFSEMRPAEKGRYVLVRMTSEGKVEDLIPSEYNVRTSVHEYGGGSALLAADVIYFSNFADQQLYKSVDGKVSPFTNEKNSRFADGCRFGSHLFYVMEVHGKEVENCLVAIDAKSGAVKRIAEGSDFYSSPRVSPNGKQLAYYCWNHPNLPWDGGELRVAELNKDGTLGKTRVVAGGDKESINQLAWGPDGLLYFTTDRSGWWNLTCEKEGKLEALCPMDAEFGFPQWAFGQTFFDFWGSDKIVCIYSKLGVDSLAVLSKGELKNIDVPFSAISRLRVTGDHLYFVGSSPAIPTCLVQYNLKSNGWKILKKSTELEISSEYISIPQAIEFPTTGGLTAHAFYYAPKNMRFKGLKGESPPLLVLSHGGPTAHESPAYDLEIQYWTSRGIAVVDVNYGGSSGYGRAYRDRLIGNWGVVDVDDCTNAALYCAEMGLADRNRLAIAGGSAGGYTTLACLAFRDVFRAGASFYGVSDLEMLTLDTHKFEARYLDSLVGPYPASSDLYAARSPLHHVDKINCPIILLQGDEDKIVPPAQSEKMYQSLLERGIPTAYLLFEKEQHGFRSSANIKRSIEAESYFFSKIFGYELAGDIEPVKIENFDE